MSEEITKEMYSKFSPTSFLGFSVNNLSHTYNNFFAKKQTCVKSDLVIPDFPKFKKIELEDEVYINSHVFNHNAYSDFIFSNLWSWDLEDKCMVSKLNNNIVILFTDYSTQTNFLSFIGNNKIVNTARLVFKFAQNSNISKTISYLPEKSALALSSNSCFKVSEDRDSFDYIYSVEDLSKFEGTKYKSKRNLAKKFARDYPDSSVRLLDLDDKDVQKRLREILHENILFKQDSDKSDYLDLEEKAFEKILILNKELDLIASGLYINEVMIGFSIDEVFSNKTALSHFFKFQTSYKGACEYLNMQTAKHLLSLGVLSWNWVEDLGIENLRKSKMSYRPETFLKKYKVTLV